MWTSRAHDRRTGRNSLLQLHAHGVGHAKLLCHQVLAQLINAGEALLPHGMQAQIPAVLLNEAIQLLHHHQLFHAGGKVANLPLRQGPGHAQLQHGIPVAAGFLHVLVAGGRGDNADLMVGPLLQAVDRRGFRPGDKVGGALLHQGMAALGVARHHDILGAVLLIGLFRRHDPLAGLHHALGVGNPGAHFQQHWRIELLGKLIGQLGEGQAFGGIRGLQHGNLGSFGVMAGILLVLGRMHARVVGHADNHAGIHTGIGNGEQGIGGHVQPHVLHAAEAALSGQAGPEGRLHGHLFIGRPLGINFLIFGRSLGDLGTGCAGIAGDKAASGLEQTAGSGFVAEHQGFHRVSSVQIR